MALYFIILLLSILPCFLTISNKLSIIWPQALADQSKEGIQYSLARYGSIPYGAHLMGKLILAEPITACEPIKLITDDETKIYSNYIVIIRRGGCQVSMKSRNAQLAGAKIALIVDHKNSIGENGQLGDKHASDIEYDKDGGNIEESSEWFGYGHGNEDITIPTIMIGKENGNAIVSYLENNLQTDENERNVPWMSITFPYEVLSKTVNLDFWYSAGDKVKTSFEFLRQFHPYWLKNRGYINFEPHILTWTSSKSKKAKFEPEERDCISGGRYCVPDPEGALTGADVVSEDLRQLCIFAENVDLWWRYMIRYGEVCLDTDNLEVCGDIILQNYTSSQQIDNIKNCISGSYIDGASGKKDNERLRQQRQSQLDYSINSYPMLFISHKAFYGKLQHAFVVFEEICKRLAEPPKDCEYALKGQSAPSPTTIQNHTGRIVLVVVLLLILSVLVIFCCRRMIKKESRNMSFQAGELVTRYFALRDVKEEATMTAS